MGVVENSASLLYILSSSLSRFVSSSLSPPRFELDLYSTPRSSGDRHPSHLVHRSLQPTPLPRLIHVRFSSNLLAHRTWCVPTSPSPFLPPSTPQTDAQNPGSRWDESERHASASKWSDRDEAFPSIGEE